MKSILVIDDENNIRVLLEDILKSEGYNVFLSDGGDESLTILRENDIDLIILDMMMPKATGQELYTAMRVAFSQEGIVDRVPPGIILTAHAGSAKTQFLLMMESGIKKLVAKPFQISELLEAIEEVLENKE